MQLSRAAASLFILALGAAPSFADCPASTINGVDSTLPADSLESPPPGFYGLQVGSYDLVAGSIDARIYAKCCGLASSEVTARDRYRVVGYPSGQPLTIAAELTCTAVDNTGGGHAPAEFAWNIDADAGSVGATRAGSMSIASSIRLSIPTSGEQEFSVAWHVYTLQGFDPGNADIQGQWRFVNLPPGAHVESCQGFGTDTVPTSTPTWGSLKASYR